MQPQEQIPDDFAPRPTPGQEAIPNDFGPSKPHGPAALPTPSALPALRPDVNSAVDAAARRSQVPAWALRAMAAIESGGTKDPVNAVNPQSQATGVMQLLPTTFATVAPSGANIRDLTTNVRAGATYYKELLTKYGDPVNAAGAYNVGPGAFDAYLAGKRTLPPETLAYMARVRAAQTTEHEVPLPDDFAAKPKPTTYEIGTRAATQKKKNLDPTKAKHDLFQQYAGHADLPFIAANAFAEDQMLGSKSHALHDALAMWSHDPAAASDLWGPNSKRTLELYTQHGNDEQKAEAAFLLAHPKIAAGETFLEEFLNPVSWAEGSIVGKGAGFVGQLAGKTQRGRSLMVLTSPYREIVAKFGPNARNLIAQMGQNIQRRDKEAMETVQHIFGDHTLEEQHEIVRLSQGLEPHIGGRADLAQKGRLLRQTIKDITAEQLKHGVLDPKNVYPVEKYFPMVGSFDHPVYDEDAASIIQQIGQKRSSTPFSAPTTEHKLYPTLDDAVNSGKLSLHKFQPSENMHRFLRNRGGNIEFEQGLKQLAEKHPDVIRPDSWKNYAGLQAQPWRQNIAETDMDALQRAVAQNNAHFPVGNPMRYQRTPPVDRYGRQMIAAGDLINTSSPWLQKAWIAPELKEFLEKKSSGTIGHFTDDKAMGAVEKGFAKFNNAMRSMIIFNPTYHPFWNVGSNSSAAGRENLPGMMRNYAKALVGTAMGVPEFLKLLPGFEKLPVVGGIPAASANIRNAIEQRFWGGAQQYASDVLAASKAGAMAEFGAGKTALGGDPARIRTLASSSLTAPEKLDQWLTKLGDWNREATFGKRGEEAFATALFKKFTDPKGKWKMAPEDAAWSVREALGNYMNVDRNSNQSKYLFFYPWLKTNVPFWMKTFLTAPRYVTAPLEAAHRESQIAGDPRAEDPRYMREGAQMYLGRDQGQDVGYTPPLPFKDAQKTAQIFDPRTASQGGPDLNERISTGMNLIGSRLVPGAGALTDTVLTAFGGRAMEPGSYQGFETMFNKDAPSDVKNRQLAGSLARRLAPLPAPFLAQDIMKSGFDPHHLGDYALELAGAGYISRVDADNVKHVQNRALSQYEAHVKKLNARQASGNPLSSADYQRRLQRFYDAYQAQNDRIKKRLAAKLQAEQRKKEEIPSDFAPRQEEIPDDFAPRR